MFDIELTSCWHELWLLQ